MPPSIPAEAKLPFFTLAILAFAAVVALFAISTWILFAFFCTWDERAQFGDAYGALNALYSGLAFAGIIITLFLQREELTLQRAELRATRDELARTSRAQEASSVALVQQAKAAEIAASVSAVTTLLRVILDRLSAQEQATKLAISKGLSYDAVDKDLAKQRDFYLAQLEELLDSLMKGGAARKGE